MDGTTHWKEGQGSRLDPDGPSETRGVFSRDSVKRKKVKDLIRRIDPS